MQQRVDYQSSQVGGNHGHVRIVRDLPTRDIFPRSASGHRDETNSSSVNSRPANARSEAVTAGEGFAARAELMRMAGR